MSNKSLLTFIGSPQLGVAAAYTATDSTKVYICGVEVQQDESLLLHFPKGHPFTDQQPITVHLDNRTGVDEYDADLLVYRTSYKGVVEQVSDLNIRVRPEHFEVWYGNKIVHSFNSPGYAHPTDARAELSIPVTSLVDVPIPDMRENENKIGVLVTEAQGRPHTTVFAFLSTPSDDIFFISFPTTFKSKLLKRKHYCHFAIDSRATFTYSQAIEWNYSIIEADVYEVPKAHHLFEPIRELFILKNPWEIGFFMAPNVEMYHLKPRRVILPI